MSNHGFGPPVGRRPTVDGPEAGMRTCLKCGKLFESSGPWNRICGNCKRRMAPILRTFGRAYFEPNKPL